MEAPPSSPQSGDSISTLDRRILLGAAGFAGIAALASGRAKAGPLNPPAGPIASTSKPLGEVEARTAVNAANTPGDLNYVFIINGPGSYYFTGNINAGPKGAIYCGDDVTLDLNGFTMTGTGAYGVVMGSRCRVINGTINGFGYGVSGQAECICEDLRVLSSVTRSILISTRSIVRRCVFKGSSPVCVECAGNSALVEDCWFDGETSGTTTGVYLNSHSTLRNCRVSAAGTGAYIGLASRAEGCSFNGCLNYSLSTSGRAVIDGCTVAGMPAGSVSGYELQDGCTMLRSVAVNCVNGARALGSGCRFTDCDFDSNTTAVKIASTACIVDNCRFTRNASGVDMINVAGNYVNRCLFLANTSALNINIGGNWYPNVPLGGVNTATNPLASMIG